MKDYHVLNLNKSEITASRTFRTTPCCWRQTLHKYTNPFVEDLMLAIYIVLLNYLSFRHVRQPTASKTFRSSDWVASCLSNVSPPEWRISRNRFCFIRAEKVSFRIPSLFTGLDFEISLNGRYSDISRKAITIMHWPVQMIQMRCVEELSDW